MKGVTEGHREPQSNIGDLMELVNRAKQEFGTTTNINKAAYINLDGSMLDFSGGHYKRLFDHRDIQNVFEDDDYIIKSDEENCFGDNSSAMLSYCYMGNIRWLPESNGLDLEASKEPTEDQYATIYKILYELMSHSEDYFYIDFTNNMKDVQVTNIYYEDKIIDPKEIIGDIKYFYKTGKKPYKSELSQFREKLTLDESLFN